MSSIDDLKWSKISDNFEEIGDDDDGVFYGLEEVDGYGVDKSNGALKFIEKPNKKSKAKEAKKDKTSSDKKASKKTGKAPLNAQEPEAEFTDFSLIKDIEPRKLLSSLNEWPELDPILYTALQALGFEHPTEIQKQCLPKAAKGIDLIGKASTGSGKTLAFGLPIIDAFIREGSIDVPQAIVIAPTRELAHQIGDHLNAVIAKCEFEHNTCGCVTITGGLAEQKQLRLLDRHPIVVVGTPGRLYDILDKMPAEQIANYQKIPTLVLDEADRLVQNHYFEDMDNIFGKIGRTRRQTMVFSATFQPEYWGKLDSTRKFTKQQDIREVLEKKLSLRKNALFIDADPKDAVASAIIQSIMECPAQEKDLYLYYFALIYPGKTIAFVNSIDAVKRIAPLFKECDQPAFGVHSDMAQKQRLRAIERFRDTPNSILIATDVAARGLDVPEVDHVVHYHLPRTADMYVHRSGRTARAGKAGVSLMLCAPDEASTALPKLCKLVKVKPVPLEVEYDVLDRLRERVMLAKKIADAVNKSTHDGKKKAWLQKAAEDLEIDLSEPEQETKTERNLRGYRAQLKELLSHSVGPRRKYLTSGSINLAQEMLKNPTAIVAGRAALSALEELSKSKKPKVEAKESQKPAEKPKETPKQPQPAKAPAPAQKKSSKRGLDDGEPQVTKKQSKKAKKDNKSERNANKKLAKHNDVVEAANAQRKQKFKAKGHTVSLKGLESVNKTELESVEQQK